jgi:hypothetical protein
MRFPALALGGSRSFRIILILLCLFATLGADAAPRKEVFVLHSYSQEYPWTKRQHEGFLSGLARDAATTMSSAPKPWTPSASASTRPTRS